MILQDRQKIQQFKEFTGSLAALQESSCPTTARAYVQPPAVYFEIKQVWQTIIFDCQSIILELSPGSSTDTFKDRLKTHQFSLSFPLNVWLFVKRLCFRTFPCLRRFINYPSYY